MPKPGEKFYKISNASQSNSFAASFMHLKVRREVRKIPWRRGGEQGGDGATGQFQLGALLKGYYLEGY